MVDVSVLVDVGVLVEVFVIVRVKVIVGVDVKVEVAGVTLQARNWTPVFPIAVPLVTAQKEG